MALGRLKRAHEEVKDVSEKLESKVHHCGTQFQNFATGYLVLGRLFFFSISQNSSFRCHDWWVILALSLLCTFVYFLLFLDAVTMLYQIQYQLDMIRKKLDEIDQQILESEDHDDLGLSMEAGESSDDGFGFGFYEKMLMFDHFRIVGMKVYIYITVCALLAITAIELYVSKCVLCN